jgi:transcriptional regulator with XRE-family HTH domain
MNKETERLRIGIRIESLRKERGLSMHELAELADITKANVFNIEHGRYSVGLDVLNKIAEAMNVTLDFNENEKIQN